MCEFENKFPKRKCFPTLRQKSYLGIVKFRKCVVLPILVTVELESAPVIMMYLRQKSKIAGIASAIFFIHWVPFSLVLIRKLIVSYN